MMILRLNFSFEAHQSIPLYFPRLGVMAAEGVIPVTLDMPSSASLEEISQLAAALCLLLGSSFRAPEDGEVMTTGKITAWPFI